MSEDPARAVSYLVFLPLGVRGRRPADSRLALFKEFYDVVQ